MPSLSQLAKLAIFLTSVASVSAHPRFLRPRMIEIRQVPAASTSLAAVAPTLAPAATAAPTVPNGGAAAPVASPAAAAPQAPPPPAPASAAPSNSSSGLSDIDILQLYDLFIVVYSDQCY